jgi:hypothetical protein
MLFMLLFSVHKLFKFSFLCDSMLLGAIMEILSYNDSAQNNAKEDDYSPWKDEKGD